MGVRKHVGSSCSSAMRFKQHHCLQTNKVSILLSHVFKLVIVSSLMWMIRFKYNDLKFLLHIFLPQNCKFSIKIYFFNDVLLIRKTSVACGVIWLTTRYFILGRVPTLLSPPFKECLSVVRVLLHRINSKLIKKYGHRYPLIVNLGGSPTYSVKILPCNFFCLP